MEDLPYLVVHTKEALMSLKTIQGSPVVIVLTGLASDGIGQGCGRPGDKEYRHKHG
jgi:hypothetical protein